MGSDINKEVELLGADFGKLSDKEKADRLLMIIQTESAKPESEIDQDLVYECSEFIKELIPEDATFTNENEYKEKWTEFLKHAAEIDTKNGSKGSGIRYNSKPQHIKLKVAAILAAIFTVLFATLSMAAASNGYNSAFDLVSTKINELFHMKLGERFEENNITFIKNGESKKYSSVHDLNEYEGLHIIYPSMLPENITISQIELINLSENDYQIVFKFSNPDLYYSMKNTHMSNLSTINDYTEIQSKSGVLFYIIKIDDSEYEAIGQTTNAEYTIRASTYEQITTIINNLTE